MHHPPTTYCFLPAAVVVVVFASALLSVGSTDGCVLRNILSIGTLVNSLLVTSLKT